MNANYADTMQVAPCVEASATASAVFNAGGSVWTSGLRSLNRSLTTGIAGIAFLAISTSISLASPGCTQLNGSNSTDANNNTAQTGQIFGIGFDEGDVITLNMVNAGFGSELGMSGKGMNLVPKLTQTGQSASYVVPAGFTNTEIDLGLSASPNGVMTWSCKAAGTTSVPKPNKQLAAVQKIVTPQVAAASAEAIAGASNGGINAAFGAGQQQQGIPGSGSGPAMLGASDLASDAPRMNLSTGASSVSRTLGNGWNVWADLRGRGWRENDGPTGQQLNFIGGIGTRIAADWVVGLLGGYEQFSYDVSSLNGKLWGRGSTIGAYSGVRLTPALRWNSTLAWSRLGYNAEVPLARGSFEGSRWIATSSLTGSYRWSSFIVEPSITTTGAWERQGGWVDSTGGAYDGHSFSGTRVSAGGKLIAPWSVGLYTLAPYVGFYGDYSTITSSIGDDIATLGAGRGWSGRVSSGVSIGQAGRGSLTLGGDVGGLGADFKALSGHARLAWPF